jgi:hypothetical protein
VRGDREAVGPLQRAAEQQPGAGQVALDQPRLVEEGDLEVAGPVGHQRLDERTHPATADGAAADLPDLDEHRRALLGPQAADRADRAALDGQVPQQTADAVDPEVGRRGQRLLATEAARSLPARRPRPP